MKFYYKGKLIRTSKTHTYTHAALSPEGKTFACSSSKEGAEKAIQKEIRSWEQIRNNYINAINAIRAGRSYYFCKDGRCEYKVSLVGKTVGDYERMIAQTENGIAYYKTFQIVELEARD